ncbi:MAG: hypothetical protein IJA15_02750, partial [Clostridia bacterium]|nr:hypothetical protein [Clostridia bacterium]
MKGFARILSIFMCMLMVLYVIPAEVYSLKIGASELTSDKIEDTNNVLSTASTEVTALGEDVSKRTASSKTIRMSDGSYRLVQYANEVHYEDDGEWVEYDNSLSLSASKNTSLSSGSGKETPVYSTASNPSGLKFGQSASNKIVSFSEGNKKLEMNVVSANKNSNIVLESNRAEITPADKLEEIITIENYSSTVTYSNVFANAHIRYTAAGNRVKEDIIVFKKADSYSYSFNFTLTGLNAELQVDGSIVFTDEATDKIMYYIPVGYMYDSEGATSSAVSYSLAETATGCTVTVTADAGWINAADRAFPIVIDPTIIRDNGDLYAYNEIRDVHAYDGQTGNLPYQSQYINVGSFEGHDYKGYISLYAEEDEEKVGFVLPEASVITEAKLVLDVMNYAPNTMVNLHAITDDWNHQTTNWVAPQVANTITDYKIINSQDLYQFDFTSVAQAWCDPQNTATSFYKGLRL